MAGLERFASDDWERARKFYDGSNPRILARFVLGMPHAAELPLNVDEVYSVARDSINDNPEMASSWASTYGKLSVAVTPKKVADSFDFAPTSSYIPHHAHELASSENRSVEDILSGSDRDSPVSYLLLADRPIKPEMAMIQALHMLDLAMVTERYNKDRAPSVRFIDPDMLAKLRQDDPGTLLRVYGNVRGVSDAPQVLGTVVPTSTLDKLKIETHPLREPADMTPSDHRSKDKDTVDVQALPSGERRGVIGITSAKKPHVGHVLLVLKAYADTGGNEVVVRLNDSGPRVEQAILKLAQMYGQTVEEVSRRVTSGDVDFEQIEHAYRSREGSPSGAIPKEFRLKAANEYYEEIFKLIEPRNGNILVVSDSELVGPDSKLFYDNPNTTTTLSKVGPTFFGDTDRPIVVESGGQMTMKGVVAAGAIAMSDQPTNLTHSPISFSKPELASLSQAGVDVSQSEGMGVSIGFNIASGTSGDSLNIEDMIEIARDAGHEPNVILPAMRYVMNEAYFVPGEGGSLNPNFASLSVIEQKFRESLDAIGRGSVVDIQAPLQLKDVTPLVTKDLVERVIFKDIPRARRVTKSEVKRVLNVFPASAKLLSSELISYAHESDDEPVAVPRNYFQQSDHKVLSAIRSGRPQDVLPLLESIQHDISHSHLLVAAEAMGYDKDSLGEFIGKFIRIGKIYANDNSKQMSILRSKPELS